MKSLTIRKSHMVLIMKLLKLEVLLMLLYTSIKAFKPAFVGFESIFFESFYWYGVIFYLVLTGFELVLTTVIVLLWAFETYEVRDGFVVHSCGLFRLKEEVFSLDNVGSVSTKQGFFQRLFNYGTIGIFSPILKKEFFLDKIHNPKEAVKLLESYISNKEGSATIIPRK